MTVRIDDLLDAARITPTHAAASAASRFDVGAALRRLAADVATARAAATAAADRGASEAEQARQRLRRISQWVLDQPDAADHFARLVDDPAASRQTAQEQLDIEGTVVFAALLYLTERLESAQFWWQLAAGAGHRTAAYCLHLLHLRLGEERESRHWLNEASQERPALAGARVVPPVEGFYQVLEVFARYTRRDRPAIRVPASLEAEVDRLAACSPHDGRIVVRPDRRLAERLHDAASH
ncbi:hypothetical protein [Streptomyces johnsoniae]|uniref:Uncharacterized protein n=1 Tax=Streptomyces johnsoniae TaxID=3075532 RepID=A0ABU2SFL3_9ACTN|nr:hypothetical protein [Streptomyces sp. DSM 41886]MDT0446684.1 hypothetical protein [Streptomyces sp. DSM 41886]